MQKRLLLALVLAAIVIIVSQKLFPPPGIPIKAVSDSSITTAESSVSDNSMHNNTTVVSSVQPIGIDSAIGKAETLTVKTPKATYYFLNRGAVPLDIVLHNYRVLPRGDRNVSIGRRGMSLLSYKLLQGRDTVPLDQIMFTVDSTGHDENAPLSFRANIRGIQIGIAYTFTRSDYLTSVHGSVKGSDSTTMLLIQLHQGLPIVEADSTEDVRNLAYVVKPVRENARSIFFAKLDSLEPKIESDQFTWIASKNKYFLLALISTTLAEPFIAAVFTRGLHQPKSVTVADATILQRLTANGDFSFNIYAGPQEFKRLRQLGRDLEHVNPYGGLLRGIVQPFASMVIQVLLWIHDRLRINYGWVLIIFGITIRFLLWPLNQGAMRNSLKLQRIQPQLQEIQKKYKSNPEKLQLEMSKLYQEHGMSPFSPIAGCLPMLIPMPILFALYFVFQSTIEFRGVTFYWLPDLSQRDPLFILPAVMGLSMYVLSWISLRSAPPNPQAKTMAYIFPVMMVVFFWRLASGLNLYYAVQNLATLPQQWLIARERAKLAVVPKGG